jgi:hypothetical protein
MAALANASDMILRYDAKLLSPLLDDDGAPVNPEDFDTHPVMVAALEAATGEVVAKLLPGKRYSIDQLRAELSLESEQYVRALVCKAAWLLLKQRRPSGEKDEANLKRVREELDAGLESLRNGFAVLDRDQQKQAGLMTAEQVGQAQINRMNLFTERAVGKFYPTRRFTRRP